MKMYAKPDDEELKRKLTPIQYAVTQQGSTERAFSNPYHDQQSEGIYVDITTGEPLFSTMDQFDSGCGWPSFTKPIETEVAVYKADHSHFMVRTEVRSRSGDSHLGHVFDDGPREFGGKRFCINGSALEFIPKELMNSRGYSDLLQLFK